MLQDVPFRIAGLNWYTDISLSILTEVLNLAILAEVLSLITRHMFRDNWMQTVIFFFLFYFNAAAVSLVYYSVKINPCCLRLYLKMLPL